MHSSFDHVHIFAADPDATLAFWSETLGAEPIGQLGDNTLVILGGQILAISAFPTDIAASQVPEVGDGAVKAGFGVAHLGLNVDDLDEVVDRLLAAGMHVHSEPRGGAPLRYVYFTAPDGVVVELTQYVLPAKLLPAALLLRGFNRAMHTAKRTIARALLAAAA